MSRTTHLQSDASAHAAAGKVLLSLSRTVCARKLCGKSDEDYRLRSSRYEENVDCIAFGDGGNWSLTAFQGIVGDCVIPTSYHLLLPSPHLPLAGCRRLSSSYPSFSSVTSFLQFTLPSRISLARQAHVTTSRSPGLVSSSSWSEICRHFTSQHRWPGPL